MPGKSVRTILLQHWSAVVKTWRPDLWSHTFRQPGQRAWVDGQRLLANEAPGTRFRGYAATDSAHVCRIQGFPDDWQFVGKKPPCTVKWATPSLHRSPKPSANASQWLLKQRQPSACNGEWRDKRLQNLNGARTKLRLFFLNHVGEVLEAEQLRTVAGGISEWARRIRELRTEEGYQILTHNDRPTSSPDSICSKRPSHAAFARRYPRKPGPTFLDRNGFTCQMWRRCRRTPSLRSHTQTRLHIGHIIDKSLGEATNQPIWCAICSVCNEGASNVTLTRPDLQKLLVQIRRARQQISWKCFEWLRKNSRHLEPQTAFKHQR